MKAKVKSEIALAQPKSTKGKPVVQQSQATDSVQQGKLHSRGMVGCLTKQRKR